MDIKKKINTNFVTFFGKNTRMKVLDFLIENDRTSWNTTEMMYHAKVGHSCLLEVLNDLTDLKILQVDKKKYSLNKKNKFTKLILEIWNEINKLTINQINKGK